MTFHEIWINTTEIYMIFTMCLRLGPVTGIFHTVSPIAGTEPEPAQRRWRRPASRPVLSRYCIFFGVSPFTKANSLYLQCVSVFSASNWCIPYRVTYCRNRAGNSPTPLASVLSRCCIFFGVLPFTKANPFPLHYIFVLAFSDYNLLCVIDTYFHKDMNGEVVLFTIGLDSGFSFVRWSVTLSINYDLLFGVFSVNDIPWNLNVINRNIHDIYNVCLCLGPVTGIFNTVSPIAGTEPEPARCCRRRTVLPSGSGTNVLFITITS